MVHRILFALIENDDMQVCVYTFIMHWYGIVVIVAIDGNWIWFGKINDAYSDDSTGEERVNRAKGWNE